MSSNTSATSSGARAGKDTMGAVKSAATSLHGAGEAIRGNVNQAVDEAFGTHQRDSKNEQVATAGLNELKTGNKGPTASGHAAGVGSGI
ncbi:hypothetical protein L228DRAFT_271023 [Xylona heveae TC161]|uniref:Uncharacterized protein n=1 Tax=Xylona heveae (strain CBS 132557 / TC161) TaxID=1328760 RepID=A0A164ZYI4_XYLHT|nr:hypothetical protein L228DRAFT_271023 [Xylona heveae TC161]KZF19703.1 hypothetical protein L228DRAFT_271023 [Xylona heveae TC161]